MVPFIGTGAADVATFWFFGLRQVAAEASASGTSTAAAEGSIQTGQAIVGAASATGQAATTSTAIRQCTAAAMAAGTATAVLGNVWIVAVPIRHWLVPGRRPTLQRHAMVPYLGIEAANVATNWFFQAKIVEALAQAFGTSSARAFQFADAECATASAGTATAAATRIQTDEASAAGAAIVSGTGIRWTHVAAGTSSAWGQVFGTAIRQPLASGAIAGRVSAISAAGIRQRNAIATAAGSTTALANPWIVATGAIAGASTMSGATTRLRNATAAGVGHTGTTATGVRVALLTAEHLAGASTALVDIWIYASGTAGGETTAVLALPTGAWRAAATGLGAGAAAGTPTRLLTGVGVAAGTSTAAVDPTIHIEAAAAGNAAAAAAAVRMPSGAATSAGHATSSAMGRRVRYGQGLGAGAVLIGATGSWIKRVYGYAEGMGEAVAGTPDWRQTATAFSGCGSVLFTVEQFAGLIVMAAAEASGSCRQILAIPDATIVLVEAAEPAHADGVADVSAVPDQIFWAEPSSCEQQALAEAVPETVIDAQIVLVETPGWLAGDAQFAIAMAEASSSGWSLALAAADPVERLAEAQADGVAVVEYQEPIFVMEPVSLEGFADVVAFACSSEWAEGRVWAWSGAEAVIAACWQEAAGVARGDSVVRGLGGFPIETTTRRTRCNSTASARATKVAA